MTYLYENQNIPTELEKYIENSAKKASFRISERLEMKFFTLLENAC